MWLFKVKCEKFFFAILVPVNDPFDCLAVALVGVRERAAARM